MGHPNPTEAQFSVYVPLSATSRPDLAGQAHIVITPPGWNPATAVDVPPLLELEGKVTAGDGVPLRDGIAYDVHVTDPTAELGEVNLGGLGFPIEHLPARMHRLATQLRAQGFVWDVAGLPDGTLDGVGTGGDPLTGVDFNADFWSAAAGTWSSLWWFYKWIAPGFDNEPRFPRAEPESRPARDVLLDHLRALTLWYFIVADVGHNILIETKSWADEFAEPKRVNPLAFYLRPVIVWGRSIADPDAPACYRTVWASPRVDGVAGLPVRLGDDGALHMREDAEPSPLDGSWVPAAAIDRGVTWRVDKARHPNAVRLQGWFQDWSDPLFSPYLRSRLDKAIEHPESADRFGRVEEQHDLRYMHDPDEPADQGSPNRGNYIANAILGWEADSIPRYGLETVTILPERLGAGHLWPRLFQQLDVPRATASAYDVDAPTWAGQTALGRLLVIHGIHPEWHPEGRSLEYGQVVGARLELKGGTLRLEADLVQRRSGPNGPWEPDPSVGSGPHMASWYQYQRQRLAQSLVDGAGWQPWGGTTVAADPTVTRPGGAPASVRVDYPAGLPVAGQNPQAQTPPGSVQLDAGDPVTVEVWLRATADVEVNLGVFGTGLLATKRAFALGDGRWYRATLTTRAPAAIADGTLFVDTAVGAGAAAAGTLWISDARVFSGAPAGALTWDQLDPTMTTLDLWLAAAPATEG
jgi:hypothetical protein